MSFGSCANSVLTYTLTTGSYLDRFVPLPQSSLARPYTIRTIPLVFRNRPKDSASNFYRRKLRVLSTDNTRIFTSQSVLNNSNIQVFMEIRKNDNVTIIKRINVTERSIISSQARRDPSLVMLNVQQGFGFEVEIPDSEKCSIPIHVHMRIQYPQRNLFQTVVDQNRPFTFNCSLELLENGTFTSTDSCDINCDPLSS